MYITNRISDFLLQALEVRFGIQESKYGSTIY